MSVSLTEQIKCVERELVMRRRVYKRRVEEGRMDQAMADREIEAMEAVLETLKSKDRAENELPLDP